MKRRRGHRSMVWACLLFFLVLGLIFIVTTKSMATHSVTKTEDIRNTKHYLIGNPDIQATGTTEVCIFCHTPHGANPDVTGQVPLWNRLVRDDSYQPYTAPNMEGSGTDPGVPKGVSLGCLSCHDGTIALDALINLPGSGGFIEANRGVNPGPGTRAGTIGLITLLGPGIGSDGTMRGSDSAPDFRDEFDEDDDTFGGGGDDGFSPFSGGRHDFVTDGVVGEGMMPFPNLTVNLRDDHPVGIEVPAENFTLSAVRDPQFVPIGANSPPPAQDGVTIKFITRSAGILPNDIRDRLRAYPIPGAPGGYYIECASCHNPHTPRVNMLRLPSYVPRLVEAPLDPSTPISGGLYNGEPWAQYPNNGSAICLSCHAK